MPTSTIQPRLWFTPADRDRLRKLLADGQETLVAIRDIAVGLATSRCSDKPARKGEVPEAGCASSEDVLIGASVAHLLTGEAAHARTAATVAAARLRFESRSDLGLAVDGLYAAIAVECCAEAWDAATADEVTTLLAAHHPKFRSIGKGNPHRVSNNWWAVTHSGALVSALAVHGRVAGGRVIDLSEGIAWAYQRLRAFTRHFGDQGLYHEGLGYQGYTCSNLLPALRAMKGFDGTDALAEFPGLAHMAASMMATVAARPPFSDTGEAATTLGAMLSWNDAGQGWWHNAAEPLAIEMAPRAERGALRWVYDRLGGVLGSKTFSRTNGGLFFAAIYYPYDVPSVSPDRVLPRFVCDSRQGLVVTRNRYRDADDAVLGVYARTTHVGGHSHDDAGSVRFMALGHDWIMGGGQARGEAQWQSVVTASDLPARPKNVCGELTWSQEIPGGAIVGVDLRAVYEGYAERYVAVAFGNPVLDATTLAMLDVISDHRTDRDWDWNLAVPPQMEFCADGDGCGFSLAAPDGVVLRSRFLHTKPDRIDVISLPASRRSFSDGAAVEYPGRPCIRARFARRPHVGIYWVASVSRGSLPPAVSLPSLGVKIGPWEWPKPFGAAIPSTFVVGRSGILARWPGGLPE